MIPDQIAHAMRQHWWLFLLRGIAAIAFGVLTLVWPGATLAVLVVLMGAYALVDGVVSVASALRVRRLFDRWWVLLVHGLVSAALGVLMFLRPGLSLAFIVVSVSIWMFLAGVAQFMLARAQKAMGASGRWSVLGGILSIALALAALAFPGLTLAAVLALIAWFAVVVGGVQVLIAFGARSFAKRLAIA